MTNLEKLKENLRRIKKSSPDINVDWKMIQDSLPDVIAWLETEGEFEFLYELKENGFKNL